MASKVTQPYSRRAANHPNRLSRRLFEIAESKKTNIVLSADLTKSGELLDIADTLGPYIAVLKTHIDIVSDFSQATIEGLTKLSEEHNFLIFEDRKFVDIGNTVQKQYKGGALRISDWAHIVNASVLAGEGIIQALDEVIAKEPESRERGILILAEMTSKGSLATGEYTRASVAIAQKYPQSVVGFVATRELSGYASEDVGRRPSARDDAEPEGREEDFIIFTTGVNMSSKGDVLGQQYQVPKSAVEGGSDFLIAGRGIYAAPDPIAAIQAYREAGWTSYLARINQSGANLQVIVIMWTDGRVLSINFPKPRDSNGLFNDVGDRVNGADM